LTAQVGSHYLDHAWAAAQARCAPENRRAASADLYAAVMEGAVERMRQIDGRGRHHGGLVAYHVEQRRELGTHEPDRRAHGRLHDFLGGAHARGDSGYLRAGQAVAAEARHRALNRLQIRDTGTTTPIAAAQLRFRVFEYMSHAAYRPNELDVKDIINLRSQSTNGNIDHFSQLLSKFQKQNYTAHLRNSG